MHKDLSFSFCFPFGKLSESVLRWLVRSVLLFICLIPTLGTAAPSDLSGDGKSDLIFRNNSTGEINAWLMNGGVATSTAQLLGPGNWTVTHTGDFNGDGKADILLRNDDGSVALWLMNGTTLISGAGLLGPNSGWSVTHVADFNGDGKADILFSHTDGRVAMWLMNGSTLVSGAGLLEAASGWSVTHTGDFNGDGKADILFRHADGRIAMWLMNGLTLTSGAGLLEAVSGWSVTHTGDFNGDGKSDILFRHTDGRVAMWLMNGLTLTSGAGLLADPNWSVSHVGDFNGDGKTDILWRNTNGSVTAWLMNGLNLVNGVGLFGADPNWRVTHIGDYNGDGKADIVWRNAGDGSIVMWLLDGATVLSQTPILGASPWMVLPGQTTAAVVALADPQSQSKYLSLASDSLVTTANQVLLQTIFTLSAADSVYFQTDGRYYPASGAVAANIVIKVDGKQISNDSTIDWRGSASAQQHSFNAIGSANLPAGSHTVQLVGSVIGGIGSFQVGAASNLSIFVHPASNILNSKLASDSAPISLDTSDWDNNPASTSANAPAFAGVNLLSITTTSAPGNIVAVSSGRAYKYASDGDSLFKIFENGADPGNSFSSWSMQDTCSCAEIHAPLYSHAMLPNRLSATTLSLIATEGPWFQGGIHDPADYKVGAGTAMIAMHGGMQVVGFGVSVLNNNSAFKAANSYNQPWFWTCIASTRNNGCPAVGTKVLVAEETFNVPTGHHGNVMFLGKTRIQGDPQDAGGTVILFLELDGNGVGSSGVQGLGNNGTSVSERTLTTSYLATGATNKLTPGNHTIRVYIQAYGNNYANLSIAQTLPLIWFD